MQTKLKQKTIAIFIAFTMILTTMLQLFIPLTVHADDLSKYGFTISSYCDGSLLAKNVASSSSPIANIRITYNDSDGYQRVRYLAVVKNPATSANITRSTYFYQDGEEIPQGEEVWNISNGNLVTVNSDTYLWVRIQDYANESKNGHTYSNQCTSSYYNYETTKLGDSPEKDAITAYVNGNLKEENKQFDEDKASYSLDLDLASLGAKSNSAWNIEKTDSGLTLTTPSTAGVNIYWKTKQNIENSYMKIIFNGKYYKKLLDIKYVNGAISLQGEGASSSVTYNNINRSANEKFFLFNDILSDCISQNGYDGGYSFVIDNITIQCFADIDGELKRSRIYKIDFNMLRENGSTDTVFNNPSDVSYSTIDSTIDDYTTSNDDMSFVADIDVDKPIYEYDEIDTNTYTNFFKWFYDMLQSISKSLGQFPDLISTVFKFLPNEYVVILGLTIGVVVILRFLGR